MAVRRNLLLLDYVDGNAVFRAVRAATVVDINYDEHTPAWSGSGGNGISRGHTVSTVSTMRLRHRVRSRHHTSIFARACIMPRHTSRYPNPPTSISIRIPRSRPRVCGTAARCRSQYPRLCLRPRHGRRVLMILLSIMQTKQTQNTHTRTPSARTSMAIQSTRSARSVVTTRRATPCRNRIPLRRARVRSAARTRVRCAGRVCRIDRAPTATASRSPAPVAAHRHAATASDATTSARAAAAVDDRDAHRHRTAARAALDDGDARGHRATRRASDVAASTDLAAASTARADPTRARAAPRARAQSQLLSGPEREPARRRLREAAAQATLAADRRGRGRRRHWRHRHLVVRRPRRPATW